MLRKSRLVIVFILLTLAITTLACGASAPSQPAEEQAAQPIVTGAPVGNDSNENPVVSCARLIPPDELSNLLANAAATLKETSYPGGTICEWKYIVNGASQESLFYIQTSGDTSIWEATRKSELSNEPSNLVVTSIDGLGDENYVWTSKVTGQQVVYVRKGDKAMIMRFNPADILYMNNESGIIDMVDRIFNRL